ncbi:MAG TPA: hypothetical protein VLL05_14135 [Terriglobales bacterium]|nr:hypothetical protein [Terriglobales bacterium]
MDDLVCAGFEILDLFSIAFAICDSGSRLLQANHTTRRLLRASDGLRLDVSGRLRTSNPSGQLLTELLRESNKTDLSEQRDTHQSVVAVPRPSGKRPLIVFALKVGVCPDHSGEAATPIPIIFWEQEVYGGTDRSFCCSVWDLTPAESRFADLLMEGLSLSDCCEHLGICRATGAFHLKNLFRKTGTRRQIELLSILFRVFGSRPISSGRSNVLGEGT